MDKRLRRGLFAVGFWLAGVATSVVVAFAAVGTVARGVAAPDAARLSPTAVARDLGDLRVSGPSTTSTGNHRLHVVPATPTSKPVSKPVAKPTPTTAPPAAPFATTTSRPSSSQPTPTSAASNDPSTPTTAAARRATVTTSLGGTVWTRCSAPDAIVFVAAVPRSGFQRTLDIESTTAVEQWFADGQTVSKIHAECSDGVVHAEVENESDGHDN